MEDASVSALAEALGKNSTLTSLYVGGCYFDTVGVAALAAALETYMTVTLLDLSEGFSYFDRVIPNRIKRLLKRNAKFKTAHPCLLALRCAAARRRLFLPAELWHCIVTKHLCPLLACSIDMIYL